MSVQCLEPKFYATFLKCLGLEEDAQLLRQFDKSLWPELSARISGVFATKSVAEWDEIFRGTDACVAPVLSPEASGEDPHIAARDIWFSSQGHLQARPAPRFSGWNPKRSAAIPVKDGDRESLLDELKIER